MYFIFLVALLAGLFILLGQRGLGITFSLITVITLAALLVHHATDTLPISL